MTTRIILALTLIALFSPAGSAPAEGNTLVFSSADRPGNLLELYTSEGCSSCPPADAWLGNLKHDKRLWTEIIPVSFHVDYWDSLGWKDRFAKPEFTRRQRTYAALGHARSVYTPGFFFNGEEWSGYFNRAGLPAGELRSTGQLRISIDDDLATIDFSPATDQHGFDVHLAVLGFDLINRINQGENAGKILHHDFVVLSTITRPLTADGINHRTRVRLPDLAHQGGQHGLAAWITAQGDPVPIQAVGGWLPRPPHE